MSVRKGGCEREEASLKTKWMAEKVDGKTMNIGEGWRNGEGRKRSERTDEH